MMTLGHTFAVLAHLGQGVALEQGNAFVVFRQGSGSQKPTHACANYDCVLTIIHALLLKLGSFVPAVA
jgi:hypothetical protein